MVQRDCFSASLKNPEAVFCQNRIQLTKQPEEIILTKQPERGSLFSELSIVVHGKRDDYKENESRPTYEEDYTPLRMERVS